jgi:hypothetical protein
MADINSLTAYDNNADIEALPEDIQKMIDTHRKIQKNGGMKNNE